MKHGSNAQKSVFLWGIGSVASLAQNLPQKCHPCGFQGHSLLFLKFQPKEVLPCCMCLVGVFTKAIVSLVVKSFLSGRSQIHINPRLVKGASAWKQTIALILQGSGTCAECVTAARALHLFAWWGVLCGNLGLPVTRLRISLLSNASTLIYGLCKAHTCGICSLQMRF